MPALKKSIEIANGAVARMRILLDVILPRKARTVRAESLTIEHLALAPKEHDACGIRITTLLDYKNSAVEDCIRALKYDGSARSAELLAEALADYLREEISQAKSFSPRQILLVPIPLFKARERERGFNQIELVLKKYRSGARQTHLSYR